MKSFKHSGDAGDIIYSLPTVRILGGGDYYISCSGFTRAKMDAAAVLNIRPLLEAQDYINFVGHHEGEPIDYDLDLFRNVGNKSDNIASRHCRAFSLPDDVINEPWLIVDPVTVASVVINRTARFHSVGFPWKDVADRYDPVFVGTPDEYVEFKSAYRPVAYQVTRNLLELAQVIAGAKLFIGNQSCACAIAEGLKKPLIQETCKWIPNCRFARKDAEYVDGYDINLPKI